MSRHVIEARLRDAAARFKQSESSLATARAALAVAENAHVIAAQDLACAKIELCDAVIRGAPKGPAEPEVAK